MACSDSCQCLGERGQRSILYSILKNDNQPDQHSQGRARLAVPQQQPCSCGSKKIVVLSSPQTTCKAASAALLKTLKFVKNVLCFRELPAEDQLQLVRNSWAQLLVLGMAQDLIGFETMETPELSMLQNILTSGQGRQETAHGRSGQGVSLTDVQGIKMFLNKCWGLDISTKEYAYLKGAILFNPELRYQSYIQALQSEAHQALNEYVKVTHRRDSTRFTKLFIALSMLRSINANVVAGLFFKPVIGTVSMNELLLEMFYGK
ncbi:nuclear receptor subfamily 0 group B member 1-like isoform X2 [Oncorhynchus keta]|uniref:nuclear receptor subfamily 0 group B member 1-like isoform X2 n=1 Tax=Oncorhynchus keta TaxID=8018 RepID=UPI0015FB8C02|nr:nuclear receptor subfamily 0 group B member 1-like isoform X2 [Oncorhynchus keta]